MTVRISSTEARTRLRVGTVDPADHALVVEQGRRHRKMSPLGFTFATSQRLDTTAGTL